MEKVLILGSTGLVGSNLLKKYEEKYPEKKILAPGRYELDLSNWQATMEYMIVNKPDLVFLCAAKVGGIKANRDNKASFITQNLKIQTNVIESCFIGSTKRIVFLGKFVLLKSFLNYVFSFPISQYILFELDHIQLRAYFWKP